MVVAIPLVLLADAQRDRIANRCDECTAMPRRGYNKRHECPA